MEIQLRYERSHADHPSGWLDGVDDLAGVDLWGSQIAWQQVLTEAVQTQYPQATVTWEWTNDAPRQTIAVYVDGMPDEEREADVQWLAEQVWSGGMFWRYQEVAS